MKAEKIGLIVVCVFLSLFAVLFTAGFIGTTTASYSMDRFTEQSCTFLEYEYQVIERKNGDIERYYVYVQEYEKPLEIDQIVFDQVNRRVLNGLEEGDQITVLFDKKRNLSSLEHQGEYVLTYEEYVAEHERNDGVGVIVTLIMSCISWGLIIFLIIHYKKTGMISDIMPRRHWNVNRTVN